MKRNEEEDLGKLGWIQDMKRREVDEVLTGGSSRKSEDPSMKLIYKNCGLDTVIILWENLPNLQLYISEKPLNELRRRYVRQNFDPEKSLACVKELAVLLGVSEKFIYEALAEDAKEDPRQTKMFAEKAS